MTTLVSLINTCFSGTIFREVVSPLQSEKRVRVQRAKRKQVDEHRSSQAETQQAASLLLSTKDACHGDPYGMTDY